MTYLLCSGRGITLQTRRRNHRSIQTTRLQSLLLQILLQGLQGRTHQQVFWFYVSVDDIQTVQVLDGACQIEEHAARIPLRIFVGGNDCIKEIASLERRKPVKVW